MQKRILYNWFIVFIALLTFTVYTVGGNFISPKIALAKAAVAEMNLKDNSKIITIQDFKDEITDEKNNINFLTRFGAMYDHDMVCEVDQEQVDALSAVYTTDIQTIDVNGKNIDVVSVSGDNLKSNDIMSIISPDGEKLHCKPVKVNKIFYLLFNANIS